MAVSDVYFIFTKSYIMYPTLFHFFYDVFGIQIEFLKFLPSFGFCVAMSFIAAAYFFGKELKRKEDLGLLFPVEEKVLKGKPASVWELVSNGLIGFVFGFKFLGLVFGSAEGMLMEDYMLSKQGNLLTGLLVGALFAYLKYREREKEKLPEPKWVDEKVYPSMRVGEITMIAALGGIIGAKLFHQLEYWDEFLADPIGNLFSTKGLTFYGGLICGGGSVIYFVLKKKMNAWVIMDSIAPALILAYAVGRIGCQVSGDGDWGIESLDPKPEWLSFLPDWMWGYTYPHNVNEVGVHMYNCEAWAPYCSVLPTPHYPTPFYETIMGLSIFAILWLLRKKINITGLMFCSYLIFNGVERYLIEQIRVNPETVGGLTQAMAIALALIGLGVVGIIYFVFNKKKAV